MGASNTLRSVQGIPRKLAAVQMKQSGWGDGGGEPVGFVFFLIISYNIVLQATEGVAYFLQTTLGTEALCGQV